MGIGVKEAILKYLVQVDIKYPLGDFFEGDARLPDAIIIRDFYRIDIFQG